RRRKDHLPTLALQRQDEAASRDSGPTTSPSTMISTCGLSAASSVIATQPIRPLRSSRSILPLIIAVNFGRVPLPAGWPLSSTRQLLVLRGYRRHAPRARPCASRIGQFSVIARSRRQDVLINGT